AVIWALAVSRLAFGWRKTLMIDWPLMVVDSMCSMLSTTVVRMRSKPVVKRPSISSGFSPVNCQATATTGILIFGKMSVGVRWIITGLANRINSERTIKVYGRLSASLTIHILPSLYCLLIGGDAKASGNGASL